MHCSDPVICNLLTNISRFLRTDFNSVLINSYVDGSANIPLHQDNETELGEYPLIASLSLGAGRVFRLRRAYKGANDITTVLSPGSLLVMYGTANVHWFHGIDCDSKCNSMRVNLSFRRIV